MNREPPSFPSDSRAPVVEEITIGLPEEAPEPAALSERAHHNRYLAQGIRRLQRSLLEVERVRSVFSVTLTELVRLLGALDATLILHDPVGQLGALVRSWAGLDTTVHLTSDSAEIAAVFEQLAVPHFLVRKQAEDLGLIAPQETEGDVFALPLFDGGRIVGAIYLRNPMVDLLTDNGDLEMLADFGFYLPLVLRQVSAAQRASELMLLDAETLVGNRPGLERDLAREIERAQRADKPVALVAVNLSGLEVMRNLSQRHLRASVLRQIASLIAESLRATDTIGRLDARCFGIQVADAPIERVLEIAQRFQREFTGHTVDDGMGGVIEVTPVVGYVILNPGRYPDEGVLQLAARMINAAIVECTRERSTSSDVVGITLNGNDDQV